MDLVYNRYNAVGRIKGRINLPASTITGTSFRALLFVPFHSPFFLSLSFELLECCTRWSTGGIAWLMIFASVLVPRHELQTDHSIALNGFRMAALCICFNNCPRVLVVYSSFLALSPHNVKYRERNRDLIKKYYPRNIDPRLHFLIVAIVVQIERKWKENWLTNFYVSSFWLRTIVKNSWNYFSVFLTSSILQIRNQISVNKILRFGDRNREIEYFLSSHRGYCISNSSQPGNKSRERGNVIN